MARHVVGIGEEFPDYKFKNVLDWIITINDPRDIWAARPTYLLSEIVFLIGGLLTFIHSQRVGGRFKWLWLGAILHGLFVENMTFWNEEIINNFWHSQTTIVLLGRRLPLHIILLYPTFIYTASACVFRLRLNLWQTAFATGLTVVLIDMPYDIMAVKFVHWTWHDTDPNIYDRHYWVPYTSYYFHATFASSFTLAFHLWRKVFCDNDDSENIWKSDKRCSRELLCTILTAFCGMTGGVLQFLPLYHPLHDFYGIHTENCVIALVVIYFLIAWRNDRNPSRVTEARPLGKDRFYINELMILLVLHYSLYLGMATFGNPDHEISVGLHEEIGPCDKITEIPTVFTLITGEPARRRKYLCLEDYNEKYFDFRCVDKMPKTGSKWYTICGTPFENRAEYIQVILLVCFAALLIFWTMLFSSGPELQLQVKGHAKNQKSYSSVKGKQQSKIVKKRE